MVLKDTLFPSSIATKDQEEVLTNKMKFSITQQRKRIILHVCSEKIRNAVQKKML